MGFVPLSYLLANLEMDLTNVQLFSKFKPSARWGPALQPDGRWAETTGSETA